MVEYLLVTDLEVHLSSAISTEYKAIFKKYVFIKHSNVNEYICKIEQLYF